MRLTERQFDGLTLEEREAYLERREKEARAVAIGSIVGNSSAEHRDFWMAEARLMVKLDPALIFDFSTLAARVLERCNDEGVKKPRGGGRYRAKTIYNHLSAHRRELLVPGNSPASLA